METIVLIPDFKRCYICSDILISPHFIDNDYYYYCRSCQDWTNWKFKTLLKRSKLSYTQLQKIVYLFVQNKSLNEAISSFSDPFSSDHLNKNTVKEYFKKTRKNSILALSTKAPLNSFKRRD